MDQHGTTVAEILELEAAGDTTFVGRSPVGREGTVFGGQLVAQALVAAQRSVEESRRVHSLHASYLRAGDPARPIDYEVEPVRDGRSFSNRFVVGVQAKEVIRVMVSSQVPANGPEFEPQGREGVPSVDPTTMMTYGEWLRTCTTNPEHHAIDNPGPIDIRLADPPVVGPGEPITDRVDYEMWVKLDGELPNDPNVHAAALVWLTDKTIGDHITVPHGHRWTDGDTDSISLDHSVWLHRPARVDGWLRYHQTLVGTTSMRGLVRGEIHTADGTHIASVAQEALMRLPG